MSDVSSCSSSSSAHDGDISKETTCSVLRVPPFIPNQRVFCSDQQQNDDTTITTLFEAVILKSSWTGQHWTFLVHYLGWNARWDKWLEESCIFADTPDIRSKHEESKKRLPPSDDASTTSRKKPRIGQPSSNTRPPLAPYCELPFLLKTILVQDREKVMRWNEKTTACETCWKPARLVHDLPARVTIQTVLEHFVKCQKKHHAEDKAKAQQAEQKARTFCQDLAQLVDDCLPKCLLYPPERAQYHAIQSNATLSQKRNVQVYGCEFLLRFLTRLPILSSSSSSSWQGDFKELGSLLADLVVLLQKNRQACFKARYRQPNQDELQDWERALKDGTTDIVMDE